MSETECVFSIAMAIMFAVLVISFISIDVEGVEISIETENPTVGESFPCDIIFTYLGDFDNCNIDISTSNHLGIGNYSVKSGEKIGNETFTDLSITNLSIESKQGIGGEFVLLRLEIIPYHEGNATIEVDFNRFNDESSEEGEKRTITVMSNETKPEISMSNNDELFVFSVNNTKDNATYDWVLSKTSHDFFTGQNISTIIDGDYLLTLTETVGNNTYSNTISISYVDGIPDWGQLYNPIYTTPVEDDEGISFWIYLFIASIAGIIVAFVICEFFM